tara:strand:- start:396 stop:1133 length:738 start_codon:yes stop_codon:yes gene_type:complete
MSLNKFIAELSRNEISPPLDHTPHEEIRKVRCDRIDRPIVSVQTKSKKTAFKSAIKDRSKQGKKTVRFSKEPNTVSYTWRGYKKTRYRKPTPVEMDDPKSMVHSKIRVMWRFKTVRRSEWFKGTIDTYNKDMRQMHITYNDGTKRWYYITSNINGVPILLEEEDCSAFLGKAIQLMDELVSRDELVIYDRRHDGAKSKNTKNKKTILDNIYVKHPEMWRKITNKSNERVYRIMEHSKKTLSSRNT